MPSFCLLSDVIYMNSSIQTYNKGEPKILRCFDYVIGSPSWCAGRKLRMSLAVIMRSTIFSLPGDDGYPSVATAQNNEIFLQ